MMKSSQTEPSGIVMMHSNARSKPKRFAVQRYADWRRRKRNSGELESWNPQGDPAHSDFAPRDPMSTINSEFYAALIDAGADETKARKAAKSVVRNDSDIAEIKASLLLLKWMVGITLAFVVALTWRAFQ